MSLAVAFAAIVLLIALLIYLEHKSCEPFIGFKSIGSDALKSGAKKGIEALKSGKSPKEIAKEAAFTTLEEIYAKAMPEVEIEMMGKPMEQQLAFKAIQTGGKAAFAAYKTGSSPKDMASLSVRAAAESIAPQIDVELAKIGPMIDTELANKTPEQRQIYEVLKTGAYTAFSAYKSGKKPQDCAKEAIEATSRSLQPIIDAEIAKRLEQQRQNIQEKVDDLANPSAISTALNQAGYKGSVPLLVAKFSNMDAKSQANALFKQSGNAGVLTTLQDGINQTST